MTALVDGKPFEITTLRKDVDCDGRHAQVEFTDDWQQDAARRDFTINALYLSPQGEWFDYFGGVDDAKAGIVRFIGDAVQRIEEDRLRILRFFRFYARFARGDADVAALAACRSAAPAMAALSGERVQKEILLLLSLPNAASVLMLMQRETVLSHALGFDVIDVSAFAKLATLEQQTGYRLEPAMRLALFIRFSRLPQQQAAEALVERLRLSNAVAQQLRVFVGQSKHLIPQIEEAEQKKWLRALGKESFTNLIMLNWACLPKHADTDRAYTIMLALAEQWVIPQFPVTGQDLINSGMAPGKALGERLAHLEATWEASGYSMDKAALLALPKAGG